MEANIYLKSDISAEDYEKRECDISAEDYEKREDLDEIWPKMSLIFCIWMRKIPFFG
jgi:hypothetical protein